MTFWFVLSIFVAIWMTLVFVGRLWLRQKVYLPTILLMAASITAIVTHIIGLW